MVTSDESEVEGAPERRDDEPRRRRELDFSAGHPPLPAIAPEHGAALSSRHARILDSTPPFEEALQAQGPAALSELSAAGLMHASETRTYPLYTRSRSSPR